MRIGSHICYRLRRFAVAPRQTSQETICCSFERTFRRCWAIGSIWMDCLQSCCDVDVGSVASPIVECCLQIRNFRPILVRATVSKLHMKARKPQNISSGMLRERPSKFSCSPCLLWKSKESKTLILFNASTDFADLSVYCRCPAIHTICEVILARWGTTAHLTIMCFVIATQCECWVVLIAISRCTMM